MSSVREAVRAGEKTLAAAGIADARRDAGLLLRHLLGWNQAQLLTRGSSALSADEAAKYASLLGQRARRRPLQYITGEQEFYGAPFCVTEDVLIPRPETELVVEAALECLPANRDARIADVGTGSGAIAVTLARLHPRAAVLATDISEVALAVARHNADRHGVAGRIAFVAADLFPSDCGPFDLIASNPPYVPACDAMDLQPEVRQFEPASALFAGRDGLDVYRRLVPAAAERLRAGGALVLEMGAGQADAVRSLLGVEWRDVRVLPDLQQIERTLVAMRV